MLKFCASFDKKGKFHWYEYEVKRCNSRGYVALQVIRVSNLDSLGPSDLLVSQPSGEFGGTLQSGLRLLDVLSQHLHLGYTALIAVLQLCNLGQKQVMYITGYVGMQDGALLTLASMVESLSCFSFSCDITASSST